MLLAQDVLKIFRRLADNSELTLVERPKSREKGCRKVLGARQKTLTEIPHG